LPQKVQKIQQILGTIIKIQIFMICLGQPDNTKLGIKSLNVATPFTTI